MKNRLILMVGIGLILTSCAAAPLASVSSDQTQVAIDTEISAVPQGQGPNDGTHEETMAALSDSDLKEAEIQGILFMREEEKLARDVYLALGMRWDMNIFNNIAGSEQTHMDSVLSLIEMSDIEDPVGDAPQGVFENQDLQTLYDDLVERGSLSLDEALLVGGAIEEIDILDLQNYLTVTENGAVIEVYQNLLMGSVNHLKSFVRTYERQTGESYQPQFMSQEVFDELISSSAARGNGGGMGLSGASQGRGQGKTN
jgi:hypothetical protein